MSVLATLHAHDQKVHPHYGDAVVMVAVFGLAFVLALVYIASVTS